MISGRWVPVLCLLVLGGGAAQAQQKCTEKCEFGKDLVEPYRIVAKGGVLDTDLRVELESHCVPMWKLTKNNDGTYTGTCDRYKLTLPTYFYPTEKGWEHGYPGPTLQVRKAYGPGLEGDRIRVKLVNALPPEGPTEEDGCRLCDPYEDNPEKSLCKSKTPPKCCDALDVFPNCFHGDNTTNLHFHGSHVSPQPPQDFVLLDLQPVGTQPPGSAAGTGHAGHGGIAGPAHGRGTIAVGQYQYDVEPLRWTQPEGTHWYHPHKHGSTGTQVGSGMAGALLIEGPFDDWLRSYYGQGQRGQDRLEEKVLVIQQVHLNNFFLPTTNTPQPLVNGQLKPKITMYPGQVQRWRFVGATMEGSAQIEIDFNGPRDEVPLESKQIAMDGIQFAPENYQRQPLLPPGSNFQLSPGNRADFLVQVPKKLRDDLEQRMKRNQKLTFEVTFDVFGGTEDLQRLKTEDDPGKNRLKTLLEALAPGVDEPGLLTLEIVPCAVYKKRFPNASADCEAMEFPTENEWPRMPIYLREIEDAKPTHTLRFALKNVQKDPPQVDGPGNPASQPTKFFINLTPDENRQYDPNCVDITATIGTAEEWTIINESDVNPFHIFHVHVNPFQVVQNGPEPNKPPYVWQDAITLPASSKGKVVIRHRFEEFTGEFVLHCHFLGHEDRGMMLGVQTVCPEGPEKGKDFYGVARTGDKPECVPGNFLPAAPRCKVPKPPTTEAPQPKSDG